MPPILILSLAIVLGVVTGVVPFPWATLLALPLALYAAIRQKSIMLSLLVFVCVAVGFWRGMVTPSPVIEEGPFSSTVTALGKPIELASGYYRGRVRTTGRITLQMYSREPWSDRQVLSVSGEVKHPTPPLNPGELDYANYLERQGIAGLYFVQDCRPVARLRPTILARIRSYMAANISKLQPEAQGLALAVALGDKSALTSEDKEAWRKAGVSHLLAVSGLHVGILAGAVYLCLRKVSGFRLALLWAALFALLYALVVGGSMSAWRAALSFTLGAMAKMSLRNTEPINIAALVAAIMLMASPGAATDPGFLLSFAATVGLLLISTPISTLLPGPRGFKGLVASSMAAQLATVPLVLHSFNAWPVYGLAVNLVLVPASALIVAGAFLVAILGGVPVLGAVVFQVFTYISMVVNIFVGAAAKFPMAAVNLMAMTLPLVILYYMLLLFMPFLSERFGRTATGACLLVLMVLAVLPSMFYPRATEITFLAVGNADAAHLRINNNHFLVDVGTGDAGSRVVVPYLRSQGVNTVKAVFISHTHDDHVGGWPAVKENFTVNQLLSGPDYSLAPQGAIYLRRDFRMVVGDARLEAWQAEDNEFDLNHHSVVLSFHQGGFAALFTGDIGAIAEGQLLPHLRQTQVLKVAHHGSRTSTTAGFVDVVRPAVAVISTGPNRHGHPDQGVVDRLKAANTLVLRTDEGAVRIRITNKYYRIYTFTRGGWRHVRTYALPDFDQRSLHEGITPYLCAAWDRGMVHIKSHPRYRGTCA